jgi:large subunit ribosomal protein L25
MSKAFVLTAELREDTGKGASRRLRKTGMIPAVLYGGGRKTRSIVLNHDAVMHAAENEAFFSSILSIKVGDEEQACIMKDMQRHPAKPVITHIDLQRVLADQEIRVNVPLHFVGEEIAVGVKDEGGVISRLINDVEITCLPADLPEYLEIDVTDLELNGMMYMNEVVVPDGVTITAMAQEDAVPELVVSIHMPKEEVEEEPEVELAEGEEAPVEGEEAAAEGEEPAAGDASDGEEEKKKE